MLCGRMTDSKMSSVQHESSEFLEGHDYSVDVRIFFKKNKEGKEQGKMTGLYEWPLMSANTASQTVLSSAEKILTCGCSCVVAGLPKNVNSSITLSCQCKTKG